MIVGRRQEIKRLEKLMRSKAAEFLVVYGRRRVGKTFLIRSFFESRKTPFLRVTGLQKGSLQKQLTHFTEALSATFTQGVMLQVPDSWEEAFKTLTQLIASSETKGKITIFLDELPWLTTPRSGLLEALDYYWNHHWVNNPRIILIVCGSSASWLIKNIIYNSGGLHNRCTAEMKLRPFNLAETEAFLSSRGVKLKRSQILDLYLALGGVPYYLTYVEPGFTATENIQKILCDANAPLKEEFVKLFLSLFKNAKTYRELIRLIASKKEGMSRSELEKKTKLSPGGGRLSDQLKQLEQTDFIKASVPWGQQRGEYYKVVDEFCLFWLSWLEQAKNREKLGDFWVKQIQKPSYHVWAGYAFEAICHKHIAHIVAALNLPSAESISAWRVRDSQIEEHPGAQIDLLIDRNDDAITVCEIKYTEKPFVMTKQYAEALNKKVAVFQAKTKTNKAIFRALISANGIKENAWLKEAVSGVVTLDALFNPLIT